MVNQQNNLKGVFICLQSALKYNEDKVMTQILEENKEGLKLKHYFITANGTGQPVTEVPAAKCAETAYVLDKYVLDQNQTYL